MSAVVVDKVIIEAGSTIGYGYGDTDTERVRFVGDWRPMRELQEAVALGEQPEVELDDWQIVGVTPLPAHRVVSQLADGRQVCKCGWVGYTGSIEVRAGNFDNHVEVPERDSAFGYCIECQDPIRVAGARRCTICQVAKDFC